MKKHLAYFIILTFIYIPTFTYSKTKNEGKSIALPYYEEINSSRNIYHEIYNPIKLSYNPIKDIVSAYTDFNFHNGKYHRVDKARKKNTLDVGMFGSKSFKRLDICGAISYQNIKEHDQAWDNTLYLHSDNPFILCDSIPGKTSIEQFKMFAHGTYKFNKRIIGGLRINYKTGTKSDQNDPRPKVNSMRLNLNPGIEILVGQKHFLGLDTEIGWYNSRISHTILNYMDSFIYFLMKGEGDIIKRTNSDNSAYPRDYKGHLYRAGAHWKWDISNKVENICALSFKINKETADDGGTAYSYKSGDFKQMKLEFSDRLIIGKSSNFIHNLNLKADYTLGMGYWYAQKPVVDTEHGNISSYEILNKSKIHDNTKVKGLLNYSFDKFNSQMPSYSLNLGLGLNNSVVAHNMDRKYKQEYTKLQIKTSVQKFFYTKNWSFKAILDGHYDMLLGDRKFEAPVNIIENDYVRPMFEYISSSNYGFKTGVNANLKVKINNRITYIGIKAVVNHIRYASDNDFSASLKDSHMTIGSIGVSINL